MSERDDDWEAQARYGTLGEIAAVDRYGAVPMPRPDPRPESKVVREMVQAEAALAASQAELERYLYPMGKMSKDAGVGDIVERPVGTPMAYRRASIADEDAAAGGALRGITSQVNPERFHQMQLTWPESTNVEYRGDPSYLTRARAWWSGRR